MIILLAHTHTHTFIYKVEQIDVDSGLQIFTRFFFLILLKLIDNPYVLILDHPCLS